MARPIIRPFTEEILREFLEARGVVLKPGDDVKQLASEALADGKGLA